MADKIAWGAKVSGTFLDRVKWIVEDLRIGVSTADGMSKLMTCMAWESGRTFSAGVVNKAGSGATGLIQFMPATAKALGTTTAALAKMSDEDQLNYVWKYFADWKGKLVSLSDLYMAILWPKAVGKPETYVLWEKGKMPTTYRQNAGLDINKDGDIIKAEASAKLNAMLAEGMSDKNSAEYKAGAADRVPETDANDVITVYGGEPLSPAAIADVVNQYATPAVNGVTEAAKTVTETADTITTVVVEPKSTATTIAKAVSGWQGNFAGVAAIAGALLLNPDFAKQLGAFTLGLSKGEGGWGALIALVGAGLIAFRHKPGSG